MSGFRIFGIVVAIVGVVASIAPHWFGPITGASASTSDVFELVERRVRGGMILSVGLMFIAITSLRPWSTSIPLAVFCFMLGALLARVLGLVVDGVTAKQWLLVAVETAFMTGAALWLWRSSGTTP